MDGADSYSSFKTSGCEHVCDGVTDQWLDSITNNFPNQLHALTHGKSTCLLMDCWQLKWKYKIHHEYAILNLLYI